MNYHLCISQFKTSVILCIQNFAKNDTENAELASKMLRQQHFLHQRKNLYTKNLYEVFQARQTQMIITGIPDGSFSFTHPSSYFMRGSGGAAGRRSAGGASRLPAVVRPSLPLPVAASRGIINEGRRGTRDIKTFGLGTSGGIFGNT